MLAAYRNAKGKWRAVPAVRVVAGDEDGLSPGWYELLDDGHAVAWRCIAFTVSHWKYASELPP